MIRLLAASLVVVVLVAAYLGAAYLLQRRLLFPAPVWPQQSLRADVEAVRLALPFGPVEALFLAPTGGPPAPWPLILFAHGNGEVADDWVEAFDAPRGWGWAVLLLEYPGYGRSAGSPSEGSILAAAEAAYEWARRDPRIDAGRLVPYGRSLGGGVAARLAADHGLPALILESAFTSVRPLAARFFLPSLLVRDHFDTLQAVRRYNGVMLVLHGREDTIVPIAQGRALAAAVPGAVFRELPCGHNDCPRAWRLIEDVLRAIE
jgi:fermentation-respiration switch protein FrsA (DUF1100 family)